MLTKFVVLAVILGVCYGRSYKNSNYDSNDDKHSIELPVKSKHDLEVIKTDSHVEDHTTHVDIDGGVLPVYMLFKTQSSPVYVKQEHKGTKGSYQKSDSKDEEHRLVHEVVKPVIQELKEIITPYRKVVQIIEPIHEERLTKVHKGDRDDGNNDGYKGNGGNNKGYDSDDDNGNEYRYKKTMRSYGYKD